MFHTRFQVGELLLIHHIANGKGTVGPEGHLRLLLKVRQVLQVAVALGTDGQCHRAPRCGTVVCVADGGVVWPGQGAGDIHNRLVITCGGFGLYIYTKEGFRAIPKHSV